MQENLFKKDALLIEGDFLMKVLFTDILDVNGFKTVYVKSPLEGLQKVKEKDFDLVVINVDTGQEAFIEKLLSKIRQERPHLPIIGLSIYEQNNKKNIVKLLDGFLTKPFSIDTFTECVVVCVENGSENSTSGRAQA